MRTVRQLLGAKAPEVFAVSPDDSVLDAIKPLRARGHDLIVFHLLDPTEIEFPFDQATDFEEMESGEQLPVVPGELVAGAVVDAEHPE